MKKMKGYLFFVVLWFFCGQGNGLADIMYVTDRLYLSLRNAPDPDLPSLALLPSDTKVEVLRTEGKWAEVSLEDGRTGWVMKKYLVTDSPKSLIVEELKGQIQEKDLTLERLREESASLRKEISDLAAVKSKEAATVSGETEGLAVLKAREAALKKEIEELSVLRSREAAMKKEIEDLKAMILRQNRNPEASARKPSWAKGKGTYGIGIGALLAGLVIGYLLRRPDKNRFYLR